MKKFKFEIKEMQDDGSFTGVASMYGNVDYGGDVVEKGAFSKTMKEKTTIPILWQHKTDQPIGIGEVYDSENGLLIKGQLNLNVSKAQEAYSLIKQGAIKGLSIGYDVIKDKWDKGIRYLKELRLWEVSVVTFPMNPEANIMSIKSVVPYQNLPLADETRPWDGTMAENRVREWATNASGEIDWTRYRRAFLWYDSEKPDALGSYKLGIADIIDGELMAVPRGIFASAGSMQGARNFPDIPQEDFDTVKNHLERYYTRMNRTAPWNAKDFSENLNEMLGKKLNKSKVEAIIQLLQEMLAQLEEEITMEEVEEEEETVNDISLLNTDSIKSNSSVEENNIDELIQIKNVFEEMKQFLDKNKEDKNNGRN